MSRKRQKCLENVKNVEKPSQYRQKCQKIVKNVEKPSKKQ